MSDFEVSFHERIWLAMRRQGLTLWEVSTHMGLSPSSLHNRLMNRITFSEGELRVLGEVLGIELNPADSVVRVDSQLRSDRASAHRAVSTAKPQTSNP